MRSNIVKISILTSLATALLVSAIVLSAGPRLGNQANPTNPTATGTAQNPGVPVNPPMAQAQPYSAAAYPQAANRAARPAVYYDANGNRVIYPAPQPRTYYDANGNAVATAPVITPAGVVVANPEAPRRVYYDNGPVVRTSSGEPVVYHHHRSGKKSALIVGGAAATGAAIGALAHGGKGAAIGALAGGAGGLAYDRLTANK